MKWMLGLLTLAFLTLAVQYDGYLYVETYNGGVLNITAKWLQPGELVVIRADPAVVLEDGSRLIFDEWSDGSKTFERVVGPGIYIAKYRKHPNFWIILSFVFMGLMIFMPALMIILEDIYKSKNS